MHKCQIITNLCKGCGLCVDFCMRDCLVMGDTLNVLGYRAVRLVDSDRCSACGMCAEMCPETAIRIYRPTRGEKKQHLTRNATQATCLADKAAKREDSGLPGTNRPEADRDD